MLIKLEVRTWTSQAKPIKPRTRELLSVNQDVFVSNWLLLQLENFQTQ